MKKQTWLKGLLFSALLVAVSGGSTVLAAGTSTSNISNGTAQNGYDATAGSANANSIGEFKVEAGKLTLDRVPNLHFTKDGDTNPTIGDIAAGTTLKLKDGVVTANSKDFDGNADKTLVVSDFRGDDTKGWNLYATVTPFAKDTQHALTGTTLKVTAKKANRNGAPGIDVADPTAVEIPATGTAGIVVNAEAGKGTLTNTFTFDDATTLNIAAQAAQAGTYQGTLTWTLANVPKAGN